MKRAKLIGAAVISAAVLVLGASGAQAQAPATAKCTAAKLKCLSNKTQGLLKCHNKAEGKGLPVDPLCINKVIAKYDTPLKGCWQKAELKPPCVTNGDVAAVEAKVDAFVLDIVTELDPGYPTPVLNKCSAGKKKCVLNKVKGLLGCFGKAAGKGLPVDPLCIAKVVTKFQDPVKGCFAKLELKPPCLTVGDVLAIEAKVDAFAATAYLYALGGAPNYVDFTTTSQAGASGVVKTSPGGAFIKNLSIGGLNIGGGGSLVGEGPTPDGSTSRWASACSGANCNLVATFSAGPGFDCTGAGCNFGTPLPIPNTAIPALTTCVQNTFATNSTGTLNLLTGASSANVDLSSDIYLTGNLAQPCPVCSASGTPSSPGTGTCDRGPNAAGICTSTNSGGLTNDCPTGGVGPGLPCTTGGGACVDGTHVGVINVNLSPVTTGTSSDADVAGIFCPGQTSAGCFGSAACRYFDETGVANGPLPIGAATSTRLASTFCIAATGNGLVDASAALPGPGAVSLVGTFTPKP